MDSRPAHPGRLLPTWTKRCRTRVNRSSAGASRNDERTSMRTTILFGGLSKERLVSVASAQALHAALPDAELWFWDVDNRVHQASGARLLAHSRAFEEPFTADAPLGALEQALDRAAAEHRVMV